MWQAEAYSKSIAAKANDLRFGWIGIILATLKPELRIGSWVGRLSGRPDIAHVLACSVRPASNYFGWGVAKGSAPGRPVTRSATSAVTSLPFGTGNGSRPASGGMTRPALDISHTASRTSRGIEICTFRVRPHCNIPLMSIRDGKIFVTRVIAIDRGILPSFVALKYLN